MEKCSSRGDKLNNWTSECEHLGTPGSTSVTTVGVGGSKDTYSKVSNAALTSKGLGVATDSYSGVVNPATGYIDNDAKLNAWSPDPSSTLRPVDESDFSAQETIDASGLSGTGALKSSGSASTQGESAPPSLPSTRPYIWKYQ